MSKDKPVVERENQRLPLQATVSIKRYGSRRSTRARMFDLSVKGCCVVTSEPLRTGTQVLIRIPGLEFWSATVAWRREEAVGIEFHKPLHPAVVEHYAQYFPAPVEDEGS